MTANELRQKRAGLIDEAGLILETAGDNDLTAEQQADYDKLLGEADALQRRIERQEKHEAMAAETRQSQNQPVHRAQAPAVLKIGRGDTEERAFAHFIRTGDAGGIETRASNDTDMNIGTAADGGYAVPTGHYQGIIARRDESMLARMLGVRNIPGMGTTVNVPIDGEDDGEFVSTAENNAFDRDAPALSQKAMTLVKYTKKVDLSLELLQDEDSRLLAFLDDFVGRGIAKTHNSLLLTEVASNGTDFGNFASATAIAAGELEPVVGNDALGPYLDDAGSVGWVMRSSTLWEVQALTGNSRLYADQTANSRANGQLLGYPVYFSAKAGLTAASAKSVYFGNWNYVGMREAPGITVLRDPYSRAAYGQVLLHYYFRAVYGVLQAEAVGYKDHPSA
jgi:HK97 family phage major capsid protein